MRKGLKRKHRTAPARQPPLPVSASGGAGTFLALRQRWSWREDGLCLAILGLTTVALFWKAFIDPASLIREDAAFVFQPFYQYASDEVQAGRFPFRNPYACCGQAFHDHLQVALLYPLRWPLFWMDYVPGYLLCLGVHLYLTGVFVYLLCRDVFACGSVPSLLGALSFALGGFTLGHATHPFYFLGYPWFVLAVWQFARSMRSGGWTPAVIAGVGVGLMALAGAVPLLFMFAVGLAVWILLETIGRLVVRARPGHGRSLVWAFHPALTGAAAMGLGALLAFAQLWPAQLQSNLSSRTGSSWEFITDISCHPLRTALRMVVPSFYGNSRLGYWGEGNYHELCFYAGLAPLAAAVVGIVTSWRSRWVWGALLVVLPVALVAAGRYLPFYRVLFDHVPLFDRLRDPSRLLGWLPLGIACLGAKGLDVALRERPEGGVRWARLAAAATAGVLTIVAAGSLLAISRLADDPSYASQLLEEWKPGSLEQQYRHAAQVASGLMGDAVTWAGLAVGIVSVWLLAALFAAGRARRLLGWAVVALFAVDLGLASGGSLMYSHDVTVLTVRPERVRFLQERLGTARYLSLEGVHTPTDRYRGMQFRIRHATGGYGGTILTARQYQLMQAIPSYRRLADLVGARYIVASRPVTGAGLHTVLEDDGALVVRNDSALPLAFLASRLRVVGDANVILAELALGREDLSRTAFVEQAIEPLPALAVLEEPGEASILREVPGRYWMRTRAPSPRQLVLTETYHPHWRCEIDGQPARVVPTNYAFMSVRVPGGEHEVRWWFDPVRFRQGLVGSAVGVVLTAGLLAMLWARNSRRRDAADGRADRTKGERVHAASTS